MTLKKPTEPFVLMKSIKGMRFDVDTVSFDDGYRVWAWSNTVQILGPPALRRVDAIRKWNAFLAKLQPHIWNAKRTRRPSARRGKAK